MNKTFYRSFLAGLFFTAIFSDIGSGFAQEPPDTTTIFFADFDADADSFTYKDDLFRGTSQPDYAEGDRVSNGFNGDALWVKLGGVDTFGVDSISGGWEREFVLNNTMSVSVTFYYNLTLEQYYEVEEFSQVLLDVNGSLYGIGGNDYVDQLFGKQGDNPPKPMTGWLPVTVDIGILAPGDTHRVRIGGYNNQKTNPNEFTEIFIDEVHLKGVVLPGNVPEAPVLSSPDNNAIFNSSNLPIGMEWSVPAEADDDSLHFSVEVDSSKGFASPSIKMYDSRNVSGFSPLPPVKQGDGTMTFQLPNDLADGVYFWRVRAFDGENFGNYSQVWRFRIDTTPPLIDSLTVSNPEPASENQSGVKFYNQTVTDSFDLAVYYNELNVKALAYDFGLLGGQTSTVPSGVGLADTVRLGIGGQTDGTYLLTATITDSADNEDADSTSIGLDSTPPTETVAREDSVVFEDIYLSWGGGSDAGSGLDNRYRVQVKVDDGPWNLLFADSSITSYIYPGEHGSTYYFEAATYDKVGNLETFANVAEAIVPVDTVEDVNAPGPPINLTAGGQVDISPWQMSPDFTIAWQNPADPSGIDSVFYKLNTRPQSNTDYVESFAVGQTSFDVEISQENGVKLYVWLSDAEGNKNFMRHDSVLLRYDATAPTGTEVNSPLADTSFSETFTLSWVGTGSDGDGSGIRDYDIRVQVNGSDFSTLRANYDSTSISYEGIHGNTYGFEVAAWDSAGNREALTGIAEKTIYVDTLGFDNVAPGPPPQMAANGQFPRSSWQNIADFAVSWTPPADDSGIAYALYKIGEAPAGEFDTTGTTTNDFELVTLEEEGAQNFYLWFLDNRGNVDHRNYGVVQLRYDATSPVINEISILNSNLEPNWFRSTATQQAQVQINYSENHADALLVESPGLNFTDSFGDIPAGTNLSESVTINLGSVPDRTYDVYVTVSDSANNSAIDTFQIAIDNTAPAGVEASSPGTSSNTTFRVNWTVGTDGNGSGIAGYRVRVQENGGDWMSLVPDFSVTSLDFTGENGVEYGFEVVAFDSVGNIEAFRDSAETTTIIDTVFIDITAPSVAHTPVVTIEQGDDVTIEALVTDNNQVEEVILFYKQNGVSNFQSVAMTLVSNSAYSATVPMEDVGVWGLSYYIQAYDGTNYTYSPSDAQAMPYNISVRVTGSEAEGVVKNTTQPGGENESAYRMISIPLNVTDSNAIDVLQDDLGTYDPVMWRLFQYKPEIGDYVEYPDVVDFSPGKAFWLIVKDSNKQLDSGIGTSVPANTPFEITLSQGWNDIGNPFMFNVSVDTVVVTTGNIDDVQGPYTYDGQWLLPDQVSVLEPWEGYSYYSESDGVTIAIYPIAASNSQSKQALRKSNRQQAVDWFIGINAYSGELKDEVSRIGVSSAASENWDALDYLEPPFISDRVSVKFPHQNWEKFSGDFKTDFQPASKDGWVWHFEAETPRENQKIQLVFSNLKSLPATMNAVLIDREAVQKFDLNEIPEYEFLPDQKTLSRKFELVIGSDEYVNNSENILSLLPKAYYLSQNYPNPFNAGTKIVYHVAERARVRIEIMNILGQTVTTLVDEYKDAGVYTLNWDGKDRSGMTTSSGVYFAKMQAGKVQKIRKMLYIR